MNSKLRVAAWFLLPTAVAVLAFGMNHDPVGCVDYEGEACQQVWKAIVEGRHG